MVDSVVLDSVKKMLESGLSEDIIKATLQDIGLSDKEISSILKEARGKPQAQQFEEAVEKPVAEKALHEVIAEKTAEKLKDSLTEEREFQELQHATTQNALEEHAGKLDEMQQSVEELHEKVDFFKDQNQIPSSEFLAKVEALQSRIDSLSIDVKELKAGTNALVDLLKKVLETDRQVLEKLERKK